MNAVVPGYQPRACPHCSVNNIATGTCRNGNDGRSCLACIRRWSRPPWWRRWMEQTLPVESDKAVGTWCGVCYGRGIVEGATFKIRNYFPFFFALTFVLVSMAYFFLFSEKDDKLTSSLTTILGTIIGFYFGGKSKDGS